jgi:hypothetical protein
MQTSRRRLLACLPAVVAPVGAGAFRLEPSSAEAEADYQAACPAGPHRLLPSGNSLPWDAPPDLARCRVCGCPVAGAADHGEAAGPVQGRGTG